MRRKAGVDVVAISMNYWLLYGPVGVCVGDQWLDQSYARVGDTLIWNIEF